VAFLLLLLAPLLALFYPLLAAGVVGLHGAVLLFSLMSAYDPQWMVVSAVLTAVTLGLIVWVKKYRQDSWRSLATTLFLDKDSNTYSLSKCQAFAWTAVLIGSYLYFALGTGVLIGKDHIPDLNAGLLGLLSISYGGLVLARGLNKINPKNDRTDEPPRLSDLITEGGVLSLTRLQLVGFTLTIIAVFLYYVCSSDLFVNGLPEIPSTLNGLLLVSQGGYLGGKMLGDMAINHILPKKASGGKTLKLLGSGFVDKTKVLIQGDAEPRDVKFLSPTAIEVTLPTGLRDPGPKQLIFIPPTGSSFVLNDAFELIAPVIASAGIQGTNQIIVTIECMDLTTTQFQATVDGSPVSMVKQQENQLILHSSTPLHAGQMLTVTTTDSITFPAIALTETLA
jgi:hypothetical protein